MRGVSSQTVDRRRLLAAALGAGAAAALGAAWRRSTDAQTAAARLAETPLREGLSLINGSGSNVVVLHTASSAVLVDSGSPEHAAELKKVVGIAPVEILFNTHWHPLHTGGNETLRSADTTIVAHELTRLWMSTEYYVDWEDRTYTPRAATALPTKTFYTSDPQPLAAHIGDEEIEYGHLPEAHTDGDIYVWFKRRNVLVAGGTVTAGAYPVPDHATGGWIGGLAAATEKLLALADAETLIVPATGPVQRRAHLTKQIEMLTTMRDRIEEHMRDGHSVAEMLAANVTDGFDAYWGADRDRFVTNVYEGLWWAGRLRDSL
jgi:glyoxylase-like metal-dependent hydrolase (beta-lactamase superfamily II)